MVYISKKACFQQMNKLFRYHFQKWKTEIHKLHMMNENFECYFRLQVMIVCCDHGDGQI